MFGRALLLCQRGRLRGGRAECCCCVTASSDKRRELVGEEGCDELC